MATDLVKHARRFGSHDLNRIGVFIEMPYLPYERPTKKEAKKGKSKKENIKPPMLPPDGEHSKTANQDCYFEKEFKRLEPKQAPKKGVKKDTGKPIKDPFLPAGPTKKHSGSGDYYGCFSAPWELCQGQTQPHKEKKKEKAVPAKPNPSVNPAKKGGPGYIDITINPFPQYMSDAPKKTKKKPKEKEKKIEPFYGGGAPETQQQDSPLEETAAVIWGPRHLHAREGDTVTVTCVVPIPSTRRSQLRWMHNGTEISFQSSRGGISVETEVGSSDGSRSRLTVARLRPEDAGTYACTDLHARADAITLVLVSGPDAEAMQRDASGGVTSRYQMSRSVGVLYLMLVMLMLFHRDV